MNKFFVAATGLSLVAGVLVVPPALAQTAQTVPLNPGIQTVASPQATDPDNYVLDLANVLSPDTESQLNQMAADMRSQGLAEFAFVTVDSSSQYGAADCKELATQWFNAWGVGSSETDNGLVFMNCQSDRRFEIETGYGQEANFPTAWITGTMLEPVVGFAKQGDFDSAFISMGDMSVRRLNGELPIDVTASSDSDSGAGGIIAFVIVIGLFFLPLAIAIVACLVGLLLHILYKLTLSRFEPLAARRDSCITFASNCLDFYAALGDSSSSGGSRSGSGGSSRSSFGGGSSGGGGGGSSY